MTSPNDTKVPADLVAFAAQVTGDFPTRYHQILRRAFQDHVLILNAKQLRELAGGGSHTTAQRCIEEFMVSLKAVLGKRISFAAEIPAEVTALASEAIGTLWAEACQRAATSFEDEKAALQRDLELSTAKAQSLSRECAELGEIAEVAKSAAQSLRTTLHAEQQAHAESVKREQSLAGELNAANQARSGLEASLAQSRLEVERVAAESKSAIDQARAEAAARFDKMLLEHREAMSLQARTHESTIKAVERERSALALKVSERDDELVKLRVDSARLDQQLGDSRAALSQSQGELEALRAKVQSLLEAAAAAKAEMAGLSARVEELGSENQALRAQREAELRASGDVADTRDTRSTRRRAGSS